MLRLRDIIAVISAIILLRSAFRNESESLHASAILRFYIPMKHQGQTLAVDPSVLDVDGDGHAEALATVVHVQNEWKLQILDLKAASDNRYGVHVPFQPKVLYESGSLSIAAKPMMLTTGHMQMEQLVHNVKYDLDANVDVNERTRHYFCGTDWHDASTKCTKPCPGGHLDECPQGERCFADTPCDALQSKQEYHQSDLHVTVAGTVPVIFCLWDNGTITTHILTSERNVAQLELRLLWQAPILRNRTVLEWEDASIEYVDAVSAGRQYGMLLVSGYVDYLHHQNKDTNAFVVAMAAHDGQLIWDSFQEEEQQEFLDQLPLPIRGTTSAARRRSQIPHSSSVAIPNCMHSYRRALLTSQVFPFNHWTDKDASVKALFFEYQPKQTNVQGELEKKTKKRIQLPRKRKNVPQKGRPNVVVSRNQMGLQVRSIKNGRSLCHLTLWYETLYTDLNYDGIVDSIYIASGEHAYDPTREVDDAFKWTANLVKRFGDLREEEAEAEVRDSQVHHAKLCHVVALSGLPQKEELFSASVCNGEKDIVPAPPLSVEAINGKGQDVIVALNDGVIQRIRGANGRQQWKVNGEFVEDFPTWNYPGTPLLKSLETNVIKRRRWPILLAGENSVILVSPRTGAILTKSIFPQPSLRRPLLADFNGDGTEDLLVPSIDAVWGYQIVVNSGSSIFISMTLGLLLVAMMLALLRNRFGPKPGKRSTDG